MSAQPKEGAPEDGRADETQQNDTPDTVETSPEGGVAMADSEAVIGARAEVDALRAEVEEMRANMLRALAEAENVRRRAQRDVSDARQYAVTAFARDMLNVADNFKRALSTIEGEAELPAELQALVDGVKMTERELGSIFERHGVRLIEPLGERFDPNRHEAVFQVQNPDVASGTVLQVMQTGAVIGDRTLRPAMVGVSTGGPKPGAEPTSAGNESAAAEGDAA